MDHIDHITIKTLGLICKLRNLVPKHTLINIYRYLLLTPILTYETSFKRSNFLKLSIYFQNNKCSKRSKMTDISFRAPITLLLLGLFIHCKLAPRYREDTFTSSNISEINVPVNSKTAHPPLPPQGNPRAFDSR